MSDEEEYEEEEVDEEEEVEEDAEETVEPPTKETEKEEEPETVREEPVLRRPPPKEEEAEPAELTEAEQAMLAARKRHEEEEAAKLAEYERNRKTDLSKIDDELRILKEKQEQRRKEREQEEREFAERCRQDEERRKQEEEARKNQHEEEKIRRQQEKTKRVGMAGGFNLTGGADGANFTVQKKGPGEKGIAGEGQKKKGPSAAQLAEMKKNYMAIVARPRDIASMLPNDLKELIKQLHAKICRLDGEKYDLEKRIDRQEYDLKELKQREQQAARNKALAKGIDPNEVENIAHPPKISVASKFDRQTDRRSYKDRLTMFQKPYVPPPPKIAHGTARPPPEWGRKPNEELEQLRKNLEPPKYQELAPIEGARPPVAPKPLQIPDEDAPEPEPQQQEEAPAEVEAEA